MKEECAVEARMMGQGMFMYVMKGPEKFVIMKNQHGDQSGSGSPT